MTGRVGSQGHSPANVNAYFLRVTDTGAWSILKSDKSATVTALASGSGTLATGETLTVLGTPLFDASAPLSGYQSVGSYGIDECLDIVEREL